MDAAKSPAGRLSLGWEEGFAATCLLMMLALVVYKVMSLPPLPPKAGEKVAQQTNRVNGLKEAKEKEPKDAKPVTQDDIVPLTDLDYTSVEKPKMRPFKPIYHMTMGLRNTTPSEMISMDSDYLDRVKLRRALIAEKGDVVHGIHNAAGAAAVRELYAHLMGTYLPARFPTMFRKDGDQTTNLVTGKTVPSSVTDMSEEGALAALRILGETVDEDLFFVGLEPGGHTCIAFMCCFPSGFNPAEKLGKGLDAIHEPVPSYDRIGPSMERYFGKMEVGKPVCRVNWSVQTHDELHNLASNHIKTDEEIRPDQVDGSKCNLRIEYQTLTRFPETRALLFSFKTYLYPLAEIKAEGLGPQFADAIEGLQKGNAPGMWRYKAAIRWGPKAAEFLRS